MSVWASSCLGGGAQYSLPEQANLTLIFSTKIVGERGGGGEGHQKNFSGHTPKNFSGHTNIQTFYKIFPTYQKKFT